MNPPLISVIVPVYNSESSLETCVHSIMNQTYKNLEIIIVDDGSTDHSGAICDKIACSDSRIRVHHQKNAGVATARNNGLAMSRGEYIGFVDSDDWIESEMYQKLIEGKDVSDEICLCGIIDHYRTEQREITKCSQKEVMSGEAALRRLLNDRLHSLVLWNKIWKRSLFDGISFPVGRVFEDTSVTWKLFLRASNVVFIPECYYHYYQNSESLVHTYKLKNLLDQWRAARERYDALAERYPGMQTACLRDCALAISRTWAWYKDTERTANRMNYIELSEMQEFAKKHQNEIFKAPMPLYIKFGALMARHNLLYSLILASFINKRFSKIYGTRKKLFSKKKVLL